MGKLAIFLEGDSELHAVEFCIHRYFPQLQIIPDIFDFVDGADQPSKVMLFNCTGVDNILPRIREHADILWNVQISVVRDVENAPCFSSITSEVVAELPRLMNQSLKLGLYSRPAIESVYQCEIDLFKRVMIQLYKETHGNKDIPSSYVNSIDAMNWNRPNIKTICRDHQMAYSKKKIAQKFFSQLDYPSSAHDYICRLRQILAAI